MVLWPLGRYRIIKIMILFKKKQTQFLSGPGTF